jgi:endo-1,4-beta-D-glucanase Y
MRKKFKVSGIIFIALLYGRIVNAQINTPTPTIPLNSGSYPNATILPSTATGTDATNAYNTWKSQYIASCAGSQYRVKFDDPTQTVSEGIGYGMLLAAYAGDQDLFNGLWAYYKANMNGNGMMNWKIGGCSGASGTNGATDADEDAAMALIVAAYQWPAATSPYTYKNEANTLITNINKCEIDKKTSPNFQPSAGDGWIVCNTGTGNGCRNPSYMAPAYYTCWAASPYVTSPQPTASWTTVASVSYTLLNANVSSKGLVTDWCDPNGVTNGCNGPSNTFGYDASRNPWRMAVASAWYGDASARTICNNIATSTLAAGAANVGGPVSPPTGNPTGTHNATFVSMLACGTFGSTTGTQAHIDNMYTQLLSTVDAGAGTANPSGYFGNTLRVISIFFATKNFWNPCNVTSGPVATCKQPALGTNLSTCSGTTLPVTLNSNTPTATNVTFTWYKNGSAVVTASSTANTYSATTIGTYVIQRDSTGCTRKDTVVISSTLAQPILGSAVNLCNPASVNLTASNGASFPAGTTWQWQSSSVLAGPYNNITGQTTYTYNNVRTADYYKLVATAGACTNSDTVHVTSSLPTPVDGCAASGNIPLSITNAGVGPYNWYDAASGGNLKASSATSYGAPQPGGTFYVQDMGAASGSIGPTTAMASPNQWGINTALQLAFTASQSFTINSMDIFMETYNTSSFSVTVEVRNTGGTVLGTFTSQTAAGTCACTQQKLITFNFSPGIYINQASWGSSLRMDLSAVSPAGAANPVWNANTGSYPYNSSPAGIASITGGGGGGGATDYIYFYNWQISTGTACARLPVIATNTGCSASPVELFSFYAEERNGDVALLWATASEKNNSYFEAERSLDGKNFSAIGKVKGNGNSGTILNYEFVDAYPVFGISYYRLKQVDYDGTTEHSKIISVTRNDLTSLNVAPNPFSNETNIHVFSPTQEKLQLKIMDLSSKEVYSATHNSNESISVGANLPSGIYIIQVIVDDRIYHSKMVKN